MKFLSKAETGVELSALKQVLADTIRLFSEASNLPGQVRCDPGIFFREAEKIFGNMWLCVGHHT